MDLQEMFTVTVLWSWHQQPFTAAPLRRIIPITSSVVGSMSPLVFTAATATALTLSLIWALVRTRQRLKVETTALEAASRKVQELSRRLSPILDIESQVARAREAADRARADAERSAAQLNSELEALRSKYTTGLKRYEELDKAVRSLEENLEAIDLALYRPHFTYTDSESYKQALLQVRDAQKNLIKGGQATVCGTSWRVGGSAREGERMVKQNEKLFLRAFNAESDSAIANVNWNNRTVMETRINKAFDALNKLGTVLQVAVTPQYRDSRLEELRLVFEAAELKQQEREEQRQLRAEQREEERAQRELQREQDEATKDEARFEKAIARAQAELAAARETEREAMLARIRELETDLAEAHDRKERAIAQAQLTKVGHVYIISNLGAFGGDVVKIGLTRRLEPEERVRELGDASVPFPFDIHALIYSENAPELEAKLHERFWQRRVNWANDRKEFFRVPLADVQDALHMLGIQSELLTVPEAREYRETMAIHSRATAEDAEDRVVTQTAPFPSDPFSP